MYILKIKPSLKPVSETMLTREGIWMEGFDPNELAYEMCVEVYNIIQGDGFIFNHSGGKRDISVGQQFHREMREKYSTEELLRGVEIESLLSVVDPLSLDKDLLFEEEVKAIANNIVEAVNNVQSSDELYSIINKEILTLKDKFKIQPK